ncbi:MAG: hypothetical protein V4858_18755 [Pseudomonadota bacterium]
MIITRKTPSHKGQRGQSTVEFAVLAVFLLVPMLLIVPLIGKYMDVAQTTAIASRYVAFEGHVRHSSSNDSWKSDAELAQEVRRRFFSNSDAPIKTNDAAGDFNAHRNTLWFDHKGRPLLPAFASNVSATATRESLTQPFGAFYAGSFKLPYDNLYTGQVKVSIADIAGLKPFDTLGLSVTRSTTLLADPWGASGPSSVHDKVRGATAAFPYQYLKVAAAPLAPFISLLEPNSSPPDVGVVDPDKVPADRLGPSR